MQKWVDSHFCILTVTQSSVIPALHLLHDDVIKWKQSPRYWPFVRGIHKSPVDSLNKGRWLGALVFYLICTWTNGWANNRDSDDLKRHRTHYDVRAMPLYFDTSVLIPHIYSPCESWVVIEINLDMQSSEVFLNSLSPRDGICLVAWQHRTITWTNVDLYQRGLLAFSGGQFHMKLI